MTSGGDLGTEIAGSLLKGCFFMFLILMAIAALGFWLISFFLR